MIVIAFLRVFAAVPTAEAHEHAVDADLRTVLASALEHGHALDHDGDPTEFHFHCHSGCAHAPMLAPSNALIGVSGSVATIPLVAATPAAGHTVSLFRPPKA